MFLCAHRGPCGRQRNGILCSHVSFDVSPISRNPEGLAVGDVLEKVVFQDDRDALQHLDVDVVFPEYAVHVLTGGGDASREGNHRHPFAQDLFLYFSSNVDHCVFSIVMAPGRPVRDTRA